MHFSRFLGLDVLVCYYALGDRDNMKRGLQMLLEVPLNIDDDDKYHAAAVSFSGVSSLMLRPGDRDSWP